MTKSSEDSATHVGLFYYQKLHCSFGNKISSENRINKSKCLQMLYINIICCSSVLFCPLSRVISWQVDILSFCNDIIQILQIQKWHLFIQSLSVFVLWFDWAGFSHRNSQTEWGNVTVMSLALCVSITLTVWMKRLISSMTYSWVWSTRVSALSSLHLI